MHGTALEHLNQIAERLTRELTERLSHLVGGKPEIRTAANISADLPAGLTWWGMQDGAGHASAILFGITDAAVSTLELMMGADETGALDRHSSVLGRMLDGLQSLHPPSPDSQPGGQVRMCDAPESAPQFAMQIDMPGASPVHCFLAITGELAKPVKSGLSTSAVATQASRPAQRTGDLGFLSSVELPVTASIGKAKVPLADLLRLGSGSVVELDRSVTDPIDVVVNNCVVATAEIVIVDGNYGLRILEVNPQSTRVPAMR